MEGRTAVTRLEAPGHAIPGQIALSALGGSFAQRGAQPRIPREAKQGLTNGKRVALGNEDSLHAIRHEVGDARDPARHDGLARGHGLEKGVGQTSTFPSESTIEGTATMSAQESASLTSDRENRPARVTEETE